MISKTTMPASLAESLGPNWLDNLPKHLHYSVVVVQVSSSEAHESQKIKVVWANDAHYQLCDYAANEVIGKSPFILQGPLSDKNAITGLQEALLKGTPCSAELVCYKKGGASFWNEFEVIPITDKLQNSTYCLLVQRDISERKATQAALAKSEVLFRTLSETSPIGLFSTDAEGNCTYTNGRWQKIFGVSYEESLGSGWQQGIHPGDRQKVYNDWLNNAQTKLEFDYQFRTQHKDETVRIVHSTATPLLSDDDQIVGFIGTVVDITDIELNKEALLKSKRLLKEMGTITSVGAWEIDLTNNKIHWTEETYRIYGLPSTYEPKLEEAINFYAPEARPIIQKAVDYALESGVGWDLELPFIQADGTHIWVHALGEVELVDNVPVRLVGAFQDITENVKQRKHIENINSRMALATDSGGIGIWEYHPLSNTLIWDDQMFKLYGANPQGEVHAYDLWAKHLHPDDKAEAEADLEDALAGKSLFDTNFRVIWSDGSIHYLRAFARVMLNEEGLPEKVIGVNWDITLQRTLENELAQQHELMQVTLQSIGDAVITTDAKGITKWLNPVAEQLTGWTLAEAIGRPLSVVFNTINEATRVPAKNPVLICLEHGKLVDSNQQEVLVSRHHEEYAIESSASPILNNDGDVLGVVLVFRDVSEQRLLNNEMTYKATHDALTGLVNRVEFEARLRRALDKSRTEQTKHALMFIDLDNFKIVNDTSGHTVGDDLLQQVARILGETVRLNDTLARLGGDEFCIILESCTIEQAQHIGQKICDILEDFRFIFGEHRFRIGSSIGLVPIDDRWDDISSIMQAADTACYAAKDAGKNRVHTWFDSDVNTQTRHNEKQWTTRIEKALDEDRFTLHAQLIQKLKGDNTGIFAEVLVRMIDTDGSVIFPGEFLPAAERFQLAMRIDRWVLRKTIDWLTNRDANAPEIKKLFVNLSGQSVGDRAFHIQACNILSKAGKTVCNKICVEITETAAITNMADASVFITQLKELGVTIALDDFGAGAASFGYLKHLNIDILKIDGQFIRDLLEDPLDDVAVRFFIELARVMNFRTVAEFVDSPEVLNRIKELGIDYAQGFLLHKPEAIDSAVNKATTSHAAIIEDT